MVLLKFNSIDYFGIVSAQSWNYGNLRIDRYIGNKGTRLLCDPADTVGRITPVRIDLVK